MHGCCLLRDVAVRMTSHCNKFSTVHRVRTRVLEHAEYTSCTMVLASTRVHVYVRTYAYEYVMHGVHVYDLTASQEKLVKLSTKDR